MSTLVEVFWINYVGTRSVAQLLPRKEGRSREDYLADELFIHNIRLNNVEHIDPKLHPHMYLSGGRFTDFAFAPIGLLLFNQRVVDAFEGELEKYGELYPVVCQDAPQQYYYYRVSTFVQAMDLAKISERDARYQPGQTYNSMSSDMFEFIPENIADLLVFKDSQQNPARSVFLGQKFVDIAKKHRFTGLHKETFKAIWPHTPE